MFKICFQVQALTCVKLFCEWSDFKKKLGFLSCMNIMKTLLWTFSIWKNFFECFFSCLYALDYYFVIMKREVGMELILYVCC